MMAISEQQTPAQTYKATGNGVHAGSPCVHGGFLGRQAGSMHSWQPHHQRAAQPAQV